MKEILDEFSDSWQINLIDCLTIDRCIALDRESMEGDVATSQRLCLWQETENIPSAIDNYIFLCYVEKRRDLSNIAKDALRTKLRDNSGDKGLLTVGSIEITIRQAMALAHKFQGIHSCDGL